MFEDRSGFGSFGGMLALGGGGLTEGMFWCHVCTFSRLKGGGMP